MVIDVEMLYSKAFFIGKKDYQDYCTSRYLPVLVFKLFIERMDT